MFRKQENTSVKVTTFCSAFTCIYVPCILFVLALTNNIYSVGKYSSGYVLLALLLGEVIKIVYANIQPEAPMKDLKLVKTKKNTRFKSRDFVKVLCLLPVCVFIYFVLIILFGAPIMEAHEETFMLATLLTLLTVLPAFFLVGVDSTITLLIGTKWFSGDKILEMTQQNILLTLLGTWCGGIVIPLDWDRPWQVWPIPCFLGSLSGYVVSHTVTLVKLVPFVAKRIAKKSRFDG